MEKDEDQWQKCCTCQVINQFEMNVEDEMILCSKCFTVQLFSKFTASYADVKRANINCGNKYNRTSHVLKCFDQLQAKPDNAVAVPQEVYNQSRFDDMKPTKDQILSSLKKLGLKKHCKDIQLIHLKEEDGLVNDFEKFSYEYDKHLEKKSRENSINLLYTLYHLLK